MKNWFLGIFSKDRRIVGRQARPELEGYYWDGGVPQPHDIRDISSTGLFLLTDDSWYPGTHVMLTLRKVGAVETDSDRSITVNAKVVRLGKNGVGLKLAMPEGKGHREFRGMPLNGADRQAFQTFLERLMGNRKP
jgi:hypothetical protein